MSVTELLPSGHPLEGKMQAAAITFTIPSDAGEADALAGELGALATATEWKRAAIVSARVEVQEGPGRPTGENVRSDRLSCEKFALLGIHGLRSKTTVRAYWQAWDNAITEGLARPVSLGDEVELPDAEWADFYPITPNCPPSDRPTSHAMAVTDTEDVSECADETAAIKTCRQRGEGDDLGLGTCPPMASDVNEGSRCR
jgi:hypothetical protein